jgi:hypothetical protein
MGGGAAGAIAAVELFGGKAQGSTQLVVPLLGALIGVVSLSGFLIAWAKLDGVINKQLWVRGPQMFNAAVLLATLGVGGYVVFVVASGTAPLIAMPQLIYLFFGLALIFGVLMTLPIGGADMPVVISIYNAFTGLAVGLEGFAAYSSGQMGFGKTPMQTFPDSAAWARESRTRRAPRATKGELMLRSQRPARPRFARLVLADRLAKLGKGQPAEYVRRN